MTVFKVGMRVKRVRDPGSTLFIGGYTPLPVGATGVVAEIESEFVRVIPDDRSAWVPFAYSGVRGWGCKPSTLEPIVDDPKAEDFMASIKRLGETPLIPEEAA